MNKRTIGFLLLAGIAGYFLWKKFANRKPTSGPATVPGGLNFPIVRQPGAGNNVNRTVATNQGAPRPYRPSTAENAVALGINVLPLARAAWDWVNGMFSGSDIPKEIRPQETRDLYDINQPNWTGTPQAIPDFSAPSYHPTGPTSPEPEFEIA